MKSYAHPDDDHIHLVVTDTLGELSNFMCQLLGPLAKAL